MTINIIEYVKNNFEELLTMLISTIITISVVMQRTKINRKVKDMQRITLQDLTIEELEKELERRRNKIELKPIEKTPEELEEEARIKEEEEVREHHNFIKEYLETYKEIKESINFLKSKQKKYSYSEEVEKELNENE